MTGRSPSFAMRTGSGEIWFSQSAMPLANFSSTCCTTMMAAGKSFGSPESNCASAAGPPADAPIASLNQHLPPSYRPLVEALLRENNELLVRVQQRARQNHLLLSRSLELMQRFITTLFPSRDTQVYDDHGHRPLRAQPLRPLYEAVG